MLVIVHDRLYEPSATPVLDPIMEMQLVTARAELATATLRCEILRFQLLINKNEMPLTPMVEIVRIHEGSISSPIVRHWKFERGKLGFEKGYRLW